MRQGQQKRMRGRNRGSGGGGGGGGKGPNPLSRSYESNGPDVKVRGTAAHIAEKYVQLARDAQASGDPILAEAYLQHAEHYFRIIAAAQPQYGTQQPYSQASEEEDEGEDLDFEGPIPSMPQSFQPQGGEDQQRFGQRDRNFAGQHDQDRSQQDRPQQDRQQQDRPHQDRPQGDRQNQDRFPRERYQNDRPRGDRPYEGQANGQGGQGGQAGESGDGERFGRRDRRDRRFPDRPFQERPFQERPPYQQQNRPYQPQPVVPVDQPQPDIPDDAALSALPSFITAGPAVVPAAAAPAPAPAAEEGEGEARFPLRNRRRRAPKRSVADEAGEETAPEAGIAPVGE